MNKIGNYLPGRVVLYHNQEFGGSGGPIRTGEFKSSLLYLQPRVRKLLYLFLQIPLDHNKVGNWLLEHGFQWPPALEQLSFNTQKEHDRTLLCHCGKLYVSISLLARSNLQKHQEHSSVSFLLPDLK